MGSKITQLLELWNGSTDLNPGLGYLMVGSNLFQPALCKADWSLKVSITVKVTITLHLIIVNWAENKHLSFPALHLYCGP